MRSDFTIRRLMDEDWPGAWAIIEPVFRAGDTYAFATDISEDAARAAWVAAPTATYVAATADGEILGTYYLKPNHPGPGNHVCNCGYVVGASARGRGVGSALCEHSLTAAVEHGFRAMQYNLVVATNTAAIRIWEHYGFTTVGRLSGAFRHPQDGFVDALVMYRKLVV